MRPQKRRRKIAMAPAELDGFLGAAHTCRVATMSPDGPHNTPLWFAWDGQALWLYSIVKSQRWVDLQRDPRVAVIVDAGEQYAELRGVEIRGRARVVGDVPRPAEASGGDVAEPERLFAAKYSGGTFVNDGRHAWLEIVPEKVSSWDFRKVSGVPSA